jgi:hypothetical protein
MTILVLVAGLFPLALNRTLPSRRVDAAAQTVWGALRYAQSLSTVTGRSVSVLFHGDEVEVDLSSRKWRLPADALIRADAAGEAPRKQLTFLPDGTSDGATIDLHVASRSQTVRVSALTGRIEIERP